MKRIAELVLIVAMPLAVVIAALVRPFKGGSRGQISRPAWEIGVGSHDGTRRSHASRLVWPELHSALHEHQPWGLPGIEPPLRETLSDPLIRAVMRSDGVPVAALKSLVAAVRRGPASSSPLREDDRRCRSRFSHLRNHRKGASAVIQKEIRVGIVGANAQASWASGSHVPAIHGLAGLKLAAVATRNERSAREAAEAFGADRWFSDPFAMIRDERVDVITIAVKVPAHRELALAALDAGKAVYCEAPLGRTVAEAEEIARAAGSRHTAIGLQGHLNPAVRRAEQLLSSGKIGRPLNATIVSTTAGFGAELRSTHDYFNKTSSGANLLTIMAGHTLDLVEAVLGPIIEVDARAEILWPVVKLTDIDEERLRETADHVDVLGKTRSGAVFTAAISGGVAPEDARFSFEIRGTEGWLRLTGGHPYGFQAGDLKLMSNIPFPTPDEAAVTGGLMGAAINVGEVYARLARDVHAGTYSAPGFDHALHNARLIEAVRLAAERGERQRVAS